jgi:hypothetical protein
VTVDIKKQEGVKMNAADQAVIDKLSFMIDDLKSHEDKATSRGQIEFYKSLYFSRRIIEDYKVKHELAVKAGEGYE